jgi:hypothetical protein
VRRWTDIEKRIYQATWLALLHPGFALKAKVDRAKQLCDTYPRFEAIILMACADAIEDTIPDAFEMLLRKVRAPDAFWTAVKILAIPGARGRGPV